MKIKKITKIEYSGEVYNLRIKDNHNYFANGLCVSNCHSSQSVSVLKSLKKCKDANFRYGLSGTTRVHDKTADSYTMMGALGPLINKLNADFLFKRKVATPVKIKMIYLNYLSEDIKRQLSEIG